MDKERKRLLKKWRKGFMAMDFDEFMESISIGVSRANRAVELSGLENYLVNGFSGHGFPAKDVENSLDGTDALKGRDSFNPSLLSMRVGEQNRDVPVTALLHNTSMRLEQVDMTIKLHFAEDNGRLMVVCAPSGAEDADLSEIKLQFRNSPAAEGVARVNDNYINKL